MIASHELLRSLENLGEDVILCSNLASESATRIARRVDLTSETRFGFKTQKAVLRPRVAGSFQPIAVNQAMKNFVIESRLTD